MLKRVLLGAAVLIGQSACLNSIDKATPNSVVDTKTLSQDPPLVAPLQPSDSTSLWMQYGDPAILAANAANEGPLEVSSRRHSCYKWRYATLGTVLADLGVNMAQTKVDPAPNGTASLLPLDVGSMFDCTTLVPNSTAANAMDLAIHISQPARYLYCIGRQTLGLAPYSARLSETAGLTTAGTTKLFDTLAAAATEITKSNLLSATRCKDSSGQAALLFNADNTCNLNGVACLQGYIPSADQLALCNRLVLSADPTLATTVTLTSGATVAVAAITAIDNGKRIATAAILANSLLCE